MLRNALITLLILIVGQCYAQQDYFVLIQADNNQPFYVRLQDKTLSSTFQGRLTLSQLQDGNHSIIIGFPKQLYPEQQFSFSIEGKDLEFQLKNLGEQGWGLFNPQTQQLKTADKKADSAVHSEGIKKDDAFSRLMAGVVSDTAVMYNTYSMEEALKDSPSPHDSLASAPQPVAPGVTAGLTPKTDSARSMIIPDSFRKKDSSTPILVSVNTPDSSGKTGSPGSIRIPDPIRKTDSSGSVNISDLARKTDSPGSVNLSRRTGLPGSDTSLKVPVAINPRPLSAVVKLSERNTPKGWRMAFADRPKGRKADTIIVIIPIDSSQPLAAMTNPALSSASSNGSGTDSSHAVASPHGSSGTGELFRPKPDSVQRRKETKPQLINSDCRNFASDYDVDKLRVKMLEITKDDDRIGAAKKIFKTKCFTTKQIRALSEVFTTDAVKFRFFEAAYPFVSDDHFRELTDLLADPVYNGKFRAMTSQQ